MSDLIKCENDSLVYFKSNNIPTSHGFMTRLGGVSKPDHLKSLNVGWNLDDDKNDVRRNYEIISKVLKVDSDKIVFTDQIHSSNVFYVNENDYNKTITGDGLVTDVPGVVLSVKTADCVPILFWSPQKIVGACHAGWRGTVDKVQQNTIRKMVELGAEASDIRCAIGACIHSCCYVVGGDFSQIVEEKCGLDFKNRFVLNKDGTERADLVGMNIKLLSDAGVKEENIDICDMCTCCNPNLFFSHRASKGKRGVMGAFISIL